MKVLLIDDDLNLCKVLEYQLKKHGYKVSSARNGGEGLSLFSKNDFDIVIASREAPGAIRYDEPHYRHLGGRGINLLIRALALPGIQDTQCGFKCFKKEAAADLFDNQTMTGWSFDIELLYIARMRDYRILEIPIPWYFNPESKVNVIRDAFRMILDIFVIRSNAVAGKYNP